MGVKLPNPKYIARPYEQMQYPGQRVQIDVKFVSEACIVGEAKGKKFYQYTAIDEYSRFRYLEAFEEHSSYSSAVFLEHLQKRFPFKLECVQTYNGQEFTKRLGNTENPTPTLFEASLKQCGIRHKLIKPYTPRHNGKVERSHRKDNYTFMQLILSNLLTILNNNFLFTTETTTTFLCVRLIGNLLLII